jgi:hypothetical protein
MSGIERAFQQPNLNIEQVRSALGVVPTEEPATFWIYRDSDGLWRVRRERSTAEETFASRRSAYCCVALAAARCRSYRIHVEDDHGAHDDQAGAESE